MADHLATAFIAGPPALDMTKRPGTLSAAAVREAIAAPAGTGGGKASSDRMRVLEGLALLWNDHWDEAHAIAQTGEGRPDFDLLHAMLHRREGDFPNAQYWFGSAGKHPCYPALERRIAALPDASSAGLLTSEGRWSAAAFVSRVRDRARGSGNAGSLLILAQAEEFRAFAEWLSSQSP
jgi:hypothetical protein